MGTSVRAYVIKMNVRKLLGALALGAALIVPMMLPADASAQNRRGNDHRGNDHRGHDNGKHKGWDKGRGNDRRNDWNRDRDRFNRESAFRQRAQADARRRAIERDRYRMARERAQQDRYSRSRRDDRNRQNQKNTWRNLGYAGGAVGIYGLLTGNKTVAALGLGGGLYSAYRYEQDRKSQNRDSRGRYELFRRSSFDHNGHHYVRQTKRQGNQNYYYFKRTR